MKSILKGNEKPAAEFLGAFFLVLCGTGAIAAQSRFAALSGGVGVPLAFGLAIMVCVYCFGHISGAHFNPAVSLGFYACGRLSLNDLKRYAAAQFAGALTASLAVKVLVRPPNIGVTETALHFWQGWGIEFLLTFLLMTVILAVATDSRAKGAQAAIAIGGAIAVGALWAGPLTGASMNPARSFAPALLSMDLGQLWIYLTAPFAGAWAAAKIYEPLRGEH